MLVSVFGREPAAEVEHRWRLSLIPVACNALLCIVCSVVVVVLDIRRVSGKDATLFGRIKVCNHDVVMFKQHSLVAA